MPAMPGGSPAPVLVQLEAAVQQLAAVVQQLQAQAAPSVAAAGAAAIAAPVGVPTAPAVAAAAGANAVPAESTMGQQLVAAAYRHLGKPYVAGAAGPDSFDCSGLIVHVAKQFGINLPHKASIQATKGVAVERSQLQPGDLVYFQGDDKTEVSHIGMYVGDGKYIHAPKTGDVVKISSLSDAWAQRTYRGARRIA